MKNISMIFALVFIVFLPNCKGEPRAERPFSEDSQGIGSILQLTDSLYSDFIIQLDSCEKVTKDMAESTEGGVLIAYFKDNKLRLVQAKNYGETGRTATDFFFYNGEVVFIMELLEYYNVPIDWEGSKVERELKHRYYLKDNILLKCIDDKGETAAEDFCDKRTKLHNRQIEKYLSILKAD